jgi:hypothetical protein
MPREAKPLIVNCVECGKEYVRPHRNMNVASVCSPECKQARRDKRRAVLETSCTICGKPMTLAGLKRTAAIKSGKVHCSAGCLRVTKLRSAAIARESYDPEESSRRMKQRNPMSDPAVKARARESMGKHDWRPKVHGGNGKGPSEPQRLLAEALGWPMEHAVRTGMPRGSGYPPCCKMDIADPTLKVAVEVDGGSHNNKLGRQRDRKKDDFLRSLGWCVLRFSNKDVMRNLTGCVQTVESTTSRLRTTTTTSSTACSSTTATCRPPPRS